MSYVWIPAVVILSSLSLVGNSALGRPRHRHWRPVRGPQVVCAPVRPDRFCEPPTASTRPARPCPVGVVRVWVPPHWEWIDLLCGYVYVPGRHRI